MAGSRSAPVFLKIGGSVLGDKRRSRSFRPGVVERIGREVAEFMEERPRTRLLMGHGGGPLAHAAAARHRTREGLPGGGGWHGCAETRRGVIETNRRVLDALTRGGLRATLVSPSSGCVARQGKPVRWDIAVLERLLDAKQVPLIHGDVVFDEELGFTILSTEQLFVFLAPKLKPRRIIVACDVEGVYAGKPRPREKPAVISRISRRSLQEMAEFPDLAERTGERHDVTGGMAEKLDLLTALASRQHIESRIVSGLRPGQVGAALRGKPAGTLIR